MTDPGANAATTVVVIDDDPLVVQSIALLLDQAGYDSVGYLDPRQAVAELLGFDEGRNVVVVSDYHMPGQDGVELYEKLPGRLKQRFILHSCDRDVVSPSGYQLSKSGDLDELVRLVEILRAEDATGDGPS